MSDHSTIEWTNASWNPVTGCTKLSAGCDHCPGSRPVDVDWLREIRDGCQASDIAFFFKQWGGKSPKSGGGLLDGQQWLEYPAFGYAKFSTTSH